MCILLVVQRSNAYTCELKTDSTPMKTKIMTRKAFTIEEANAELPRLEEILHRIEAKKAAVRHHDQKLQVLDALWGESVARTTNPDHAAFDGHSSRVDGLVLDIKTIVEEEINAAGIRFPQGGIEHGLLDFPTTYKGRWVLLCWQRGEPRVGYWHEPNGGYAGRREITAEHIITMGKEDDPDTVNGSDLNF